MSKVQSVKRKPIKIFLDKERELKYDLNSFAEMEEKYGTIDKAIKAMENGSIKAIRFILWAGLIHEDDSITEKDVGAMITMQDLEQLSEKLNTAMSGDLPEPEDKELQGPNA